MVTLALTLVLASAEVSAPHTPTLSEWNEDRLSLNRNAMWVLGAWAVGNMATGAIGFGVSGDETWRHFHLGNLIWNGVNLALAIIGLVNNWKADGKPLDAKELMKGSQTLEKVFFINAGLDVAYLATAAFLLQRGDATGDVRFTGFGQALLLQGGFLLVFDLTMALLNTRMSNKLFDRLTLTPLGVSGTF